MDELLKDVFNGTPWEVEFLPIKANCHADPKTSHITVSFAALLSLWATAHAGLLICNQAAQAMRAKQTELDPETNPSVARALELVRAAQGLIREKSTPWREDLPMPNPTPPIGSHDWAVNNLFLGAVGWILLHEIAHINLNHEEVTSDSITQRQEHEADRWASNWIFDKLQDEPTRAFRIFATATALTWIGLVDDIRRGSTTHPHASERLGKCFSLFGGDAESAGLEFATYLVKVFFTPSIKLPDAETPEDALRDALISYSQKPR